VDGPAGPPFPDGGPEAEALSRGLVAPAARLVLGRRPAASPRDEPKVEALSRDWAAAEA